MVLVVGYCTFLGWIGLTRSLSRMYRDLSPIWKNGREDEMKIFLQWVAVLSVIAGIGVFQISTSAIHEILAVLFFINGVVAASAFGILNAMGAHLEAVKELHNNPENFIN